MASPQTIVSNRFAQFADAPNAIIGFPNNEPVVMAAALNRLYGIQ